MAVTIPSQVKDPDKIKSRRAQIVAAAVRLFAEKGFHKTTTREIAKASGLSNGALYEYVESKEDVLFLVCQHIHREMEEQLRLSLADHASGADRLRQAIMSFLKVIDDMKEDVLLIYQESKSLPANFLHEMLRDEEQITMIFQTLLQDGLADGSLRVEPDVIPLLAHDVVVSGEMWAFRRWSMKDVPFEKFADVQVKMLMLACGASQTTEPDATDGENPTGGAKL